MPPSTQAQLKETSVSHSNLLSVLIKRQVSTSKTLIFRRKTQARHWTIPLLVVKPEPQ